MADAMPDTKLTTPPRRSADEGQGNDVSAKSPVTESKAQRGTSPIVAQESGPSSSDPSTSKRRASEAVETAESSPGEASGSRAPQRRRVIDTGRGRRMLGLLNQTLSQAKQDEEKRNSGTAAKRRADLEARMASKREADEADIQAARQARAEARRLERLIQTEAQRARKLAELIVAGDAEHATRKVQKRRLSAFLVTSGSMALEQGEALEKANRERRRRLIERGAEDEDGKVLDAALLADTLWTEGTTTDVAVSADVAMALHPPSELRNARARRPPAADVDIPRDAHPIYFLPKQLTAAQERRLDDQEDAVDAELDKAEEEWKARREALVGELGRIKERIKGLLKGEEGERGATAKRAGRGDSEVNGVEKQGGDEARDKVEKQEEKQAVPKDDGDAQKMKEEEGKGQRQDKDEAMADGA